MNTFDHKKYFEALKLLLREAESRGYEVKYVSDVGDVMGDLLGCQFDSDKRGGYVYFWDTGLVGRQLLDYGTGKEIIEDATGKMDDGEVNAFIADLATKL